MSGSSRLSTIMSEEYVEEYEFIEGVEDLSMYRPGGYHPVAIGDSFCDGRYEVVTKLGHGGYSMIWLGRDHQLNRYVAIKIPIAQVENDAELKITRRLTSLLRQDPEGKRFVSVLLDHFTLIGPNGSHRCLVLEPARINLGKAKDKSPVSYELYFQPETCRAIMGQVIQAVAVLHDVGVVHGDLHAGNVLFHLPEVIDNLSIEEFYERFHKPYSRKVIRSDGQEIKASAPESVVFSAWFGVGPEKLKVEETELFLCDFGESYLPAEIERYQSNTLMTNAPPEARFSDNPMSFPSDMWTLGCNLFQIMGCGPMFRSFFQEEDAITRQHVDTCGKLPLDWWEKWDARSQFFDDDCNPISESNECDTFEERFERGMQFHRRRLGMELVSDEERDDFLDMLKRVIVLDPAQRLTIHELMQTRWFHRWIQPALEKVRQAKASVVAAGPTDTTEIAQRKEDLTESSED